MEQAICRDKQTHKDKSGGDLQLGDVAHGIVLVGAVTPDGQAVWVVVDVGAVGGRAGAEVVVYVPSCQRRLLEPELGEHRLQRARCKHECPLLYFQLKKKEA